MVTLNLRDYSAGTSAIYTVLLILILILPLTSVGRYVNVDTYNGTKITAAPHYVRCCPVRCVCSFGFKVFSEVTDCCPARLVPNCHQTAGPQTTAKPKQTSLLVSSLISTSILTL